MSRVARAARGAATLALALLLASCASIAQHPAPTPATAIAPSTGRPLSSQPPDSSRIPDATPRIEPRSALGNPPFYEVAGRRYVVLASAEGYRERGVASWYGPRFDGLRTATGDPYDMFGMTAAHKTLPLPCYARVTNLSNGRSVLVRVNDRGPFVANRIIDLSYTAAAKLDMLRNGTAFVEVEAVLPLGPEPGPPALAHEVSVAAHESAAAATPSVTASQYYIQVGAFSLERNAEQAAQRLRAAGVAHVLLLSASSTQPLRRVRVGPITSVQEFDQLIERLAALGFSGARLAQD